MLLNLDERLAIRNAATLAQCQAAYDDAAPIESDEIHERILAIEAAEELLATAKAELCNLRPMLGKADRLMADAADCLIQE